ncbi:phage tail tape measure protein [Streptomyces sp. bgisy027]|uniref:phage tail tape measure protein n=1 Tax=Streptomyces sp. bgisy027 TaxID=3413770 RepID=UPI003D7504E3
MAVLDELLVRLGVDMSEAEGEIDRGAQGIENRLTGLQAAGGVAAAGLGAAFVMGLDSAMDITTVTDRLQDQLGLTEQEAARAGQISGDVFAAGWGESMGEVGDALGAVVSSVGELGDFTDAELQDMSKSALRLADRLQVDVGESAKAAGQLVKQGLVDDAAEAFDVMTVAAREFPEAMRGDIPAVVAEYGKHFKQIGLDAQTSFGLMSQFVKAGGRDIDQASDVLHEFARITTEESERAAEGFKALGLNADTMLSDIHKGGKPAADALGLTLEALRGVKDPAKQAELGVALFGDMAGEATTALLAMDPATALAGTGLDNVKGAAAAANTALENSPAQQFDSIMRTVSTTLGEMLLPALRFVSELFKEHPGLVQALVPVVLALAAAMSIAAIAVWAMNSAMLANPIFWIIAGIAAAVAGIVVLIVMYWDEIKSATETAWSWVVDKVTWAKDAVLAAIDWLGQIPGKIAGWFNQAKDWAIRKAMELLTWLQGLPGRTSSALSGLLGALRQRATSAFQGMRDAAVQRALALVSWVRGLPGRLSRAIGSLGSLLYGKGQDVVRGLWNGIKSMGSWIWGKAKNFVSGIVDSVKSGFGIFSPSRVMAKEVGRFLPPGIVEGAEDEAPAMNKALNSLVDIDNLSGFNTGGRARMGVQPAGTAMRVEFAPGGGDAFTDWLMETIRIRFGGDVAQLGQG